MNADVVIPSFVARGVQTRDEAGVIRYGSEADLRDAIAAHWWFLGANVQIEVKVPNCGFIDVLVELPGTEFIIEVKKVITTATHARQAFQQVHAGGVLMRPYPRFLLSSFASGVGGAAGVCVVIALAAAAKDERADAAHKSSAGSAAEPSGSSGGTVQDQPNQTAAGRDSAGQRTSHTSRSADFDQLTEDRINAQRKHR